ncbi:MAG: hypothetical protein R3D55_08650 [Chloroflexota bacterium]
MALSWTNGTAKIELVQAVIPEQLVYAQLDTHHLLDLRDHLAKELQAAGPAAGRPLETFVAQTHIKLNDDDFDQTVTGP